MNIQNTKKIYQNYGKKTVKKRRMIMVKGYPICGYMEAFELSHKTEEEMKKFGFF